MIQPTIDGKALAAKRRKRRIHPNQKIAASLRVLKLLREAEWMVSPDWAPREERHAILEAVDEILSSEWAQSMLKDRR